MTIQLDGGVPTESSSARLGPIPERTRSQKYSELALDAIAALSLVFAATLVPLMIFGVVTVLSGFLGAGALVLLAFVCHKSSLKVFGDTPEIRQMRDNVSKRLAAGEPLETLEKDYSPEGFWPRIFGLGLISQEVFSQKCSETMQRKDLNQIFSFYRVLTHYHNRAALQTGIFYEIPHPSKWKSKWKLETQQMCFIEIIQHYKVRDLDFFHILAEGELSLLRRLEGALERDPSLPNQELLNAQYQAQRS